MRRSGTMRKTLCGALALSLILVSGYCFTVPASNVQLVAEPSVDAIVRQSWDQADVRGLVLLLPSFLTDRFDGLPATISQIRRAYPWNATIRVAVGAPDIAIRQNTMTAVVFLKWNRAFSVTEVDSAWAVLDVNGFPTSASSFLGACLMYGDLCRDLLTHRSVLNIARIAMVADTGMVVELKDGKTLIFGDASESSSKIRRALAVVDMAAFKTRAVTVDLRFAGQAVIPETP